MCTIRHRDTVSERLYLVDWGSGFSPLTSEFALDLDDLRFQWPAKPESLHGQKRHQYKTECEGKSKNHLARFPRSLGPHHRNLARDAEHAG